ncbi:MAG TPA: cupin domain-containing protein [Verrucomicrobiae bacterium]|nr:cupin domain-containing protein [Verrucomicrobiae bacterium]
MKSAFPEGTINQIALLGGKVLKSTLPLLDSSSAASAKGPKRLSLPQGDLSNFYDGDEGIRYAAFIELKAGSPRGNHLHRVKVEHVYLISGEVSLIVQNSASDRVTVELKPGDLVRIETGIAHVFCPVQDGCAVEFSPNRFDPADVERFALI